MKMVQDDKETESVWASRACMAFSFAIKQKVEWRDPDTQRRSVVKILHDD